MSNNENISVPKLNGNQKFDTSSVIEISLEEAIRNAEEETLSNDGKNSVSKLQELLSTQYNIIPIYEEIECTQSNLQLSFSYKVSIIYNGEEIFATGISDSKKRAKQDAAKALNEKLSLFIHDNSSTATTSNNVTKHTTLQENDEVQNKSSFSIERFASNDVQIDKVFGDSAKHEISTLQQNEDQNLCNNESSLSKNLILFIQSTFFFDDFSGMEYRNSISLLQELLIRHKIIPKYELVGVKGPDHQRIFSFRASIYIEKLKNHLEEFGHDHTKQKAKNAAANALIKKLFSIVKSAENNVSKGDKISATDTYLLSKETAPNKVMLQNHSFCTKTVNFKNDTNTTSFETNIKNEIYDNCKVTTQENININAVGLLQEMCAAKYFQFPNYEVVKEEGLAHLKVFTIACKLGKHCESGCGFNKKKAKQDAAYKMLQRLKEFKLETK